MQIVLTQELIMDNSHSLSIKHLPIPTGEKFTVIILRDQENKTELLRENSNTHRINKLAGKYKNRVTTATADIENIKEMAMTIAMAEKYGYAD